MSTIRECNNAVNYVQVYYHLFLLSKMFTAIVAIDISCLWELEAVSKYFFLSLIIDEAKMQK